MARMSSSLRIAAALIAVVCWAGLAVQFKAITDQGFSAPETLWIMVRYFTILTNLTVAVVCTGVALGQTGFAAASLLGGMTMAILLVGIVNHLLLRGLLELSGGARLADRILHYVTPVAVPAFWLFLIPKGGLSRRGPLIWTGCALAYLVYALVRGFAEGKFAYPFLDVVQNGWANTSMTILVVLLAFTSCSFALVWLDNLLARVLNSKPGDR